MGGVGRKSLIFFALSAASIFGIFCKYLLAARNFGGENGNIII